jgi:hypothetical protein
LENAVRDSSLASRESLRGKGTRALRAKCAMD